MSEMKNKFVCRKMTWENIKMRIFSVEPFASLYLIFKRKDAVNISYASTPAVCSVRMATREILCRWRIYTFSENGHQFSKITSRKSRATSLSCDPRLIHSGKNTRITLWGTLRKTFTIRNFSNVVLMLRLNNFNFAKTFSRRFGTGSF